MINIFRLGRAIVVLAALLSAGFAQAQTNVALAANGGVARASSTYSANYPAAAVINGDRKGLNWGRGGGWNDRTPGAYPDWVQVNFPAVKTIGEIDVFTVQDTYSAPLEPTASMTFTKYGIVDFQVQYWNGNAWITVPGGSVTGNNRVWRKFTFTPVSTDRIRIYVTKALSTYSRLTEVEAWTATAGNNPPTVNLTSPANGATFTAPANVSLAATAADSDGSIAKVEFYRGTTLIGTAMSAPYTYTDGGLAAGSYSYAAKAYDNLGATTTSSAVGITVAAAALSTLTVTITGSGTVTSTPSGLTCSGTSCTGKFVNGATVTLTAVPPTGYSIAWSGACVGNASTCVIQLNGNTQVALAFAPPLSYTETVTINGAGSGTVVSTPAGLNCPGTCSAGFAAGSAITLTATAKDSSSIAWGGACAGATGNTCSRHITQNETAMVTFTPLPTTVPPPLIVATDFVAGPTSGGENNLGAYLTVYGTNLGNFSDWGNTSHLYIGGVEVANYRFLQPVMGGANNKPAALLGVQALGVQVGSLGGAAAGSVLKIDMTVNGVHPSNPADGSGNYKDMMTKYDGTSDALTWTVQPGPIVFVDIVNGNDSNAGTISAPLQHVQGASGKTGALRMATGDTSKDGTPPGTWVVVRGGNYSYSGTQFIGSGDGYFIANLFRIGGTAPTGAANSGPICITSFPGTAGANAPELVKFYPQPHLASTSNDEGGGGFYGNDQARADTANPYDGATPYTKWIHWSRIFISSSPYGARDAAPINFASSCDYCRVFNTELTWPNWIGNSANTTNAAGIAGNGRHVKVGLNYIHDISGFTGDLQNHGIYLDGSLTSTNDAVVAFNTFKNLTAGNGIQTYDAQSDDKLLNISIHHNWVENAAKHGLNQGNMTGSAAWYNNIVLYSGEAGIRIVGIDQTGSNATRVYNNTVYGWDRSATGMRYGYFDDGGTTGTVDVRNNIFMLPSGAPYNGANGGFVGIDVGQDRFYSNQYYDANGMYTTKYSGDASGSYGNPNFTTAGTDFSLQTGSPAIDTGASLLSGEFRPYGLLLNPAPQGAAHDRGAYER